MTRPGSNRAVQALLLAAQALWKSPSYLGYYYRRMRARHGTPKAITATVHKRARIVYHLLKTGKTYDETVFADQEIFHKKRLESNLRKQKHISRFFNEFQRKYRFLFLRRYLFIVTDCQSKQSTPAHNRITFVYSKIRVKKMRE